jgi:hypothetical protein
MTAKEILAELKPLGSDSYKKVMSNHGVKEPFLASRLVTCKRSRSASRRITNSRSTFTTPVTTTQCIWPD